MAFPTQRDVTLDPLAHLQLSPKRRPGDALMVGNDALPA